MADITISEEVIDEIDYSESFDYDALWKDFIHEFWRDILERFMPDLYDKADLDHEAEFLEKELRDLLGDSEPSKNFVDELMKVFLKDGGEEWVLLHIEIQGKGGEDISRRMFRYYCLLFTHHDKHPTALAILTAKRPKREGEPGIYSAEVFGTIITYKYNVIKAYEFTDEELMTGGTLADLFIYALKVADKHKRSEYTRFTYMKEILRTLEQKKYDRKNRRVFMTYLERTIRISSQEYRDELWKQEDKILKGEDNVAYKSVAQELYERGLVQGAMNGMLQANNDIAREIIKRGLMTDEQITSITRCTLEEVRALRREIETGKIN